MIKKTKTDYIINAINIVILTVILFIMLYPLYFVVIASVSDPFSVSKGQVFFMPKGFTLDAYKNVFNEPRIWMGYRNTIIYTVLSTTLSLTLTIPCAYGLSKKNLPGRGVLGVFFLIPLYFSSGLIPSYLQMKEYNLIDKPYTLIVIGAVSVYNMIVTRVFFQSTIPDELYEASRIDGAGEFRTFFRIALPLAKPVIAVMTLFFAVSKWNDYFTALVYISKNDFLPLQMVLRSILLQSQTALQQVDTSSMDADAIKAAARLSYMAEAMKYALIFISSAPLLIAYPFVQKHFVKGMMIGSVKG